MSFNDRNLSHNQLRLFMHSDDLKEGVNSGSMYSVDRKFYGSNDDLWDSKEKEARSTGWKHGAGVYDDIKADGGVREPIKLGLSGGSPGHGHTELAITDGHHRIASASAIGKEGGQGFVPVTYFDRSTVVPFAKQW